MSEPLEDLTAFQRDLLTVVASIKRPNGQDVQAELAKYYSEKPDSGRLYPNLDELVERGLVEKEDVSRIANAYVISDEGKEALASDLEWRGDLFRR